jgi:hypothetical protein
VTPPILLELDARLEKERSVWADLLKHGTAEMRRRAGMNRRALE